MDVLGFSKETGKKEKGMASRNSNLKKFKRNHGLCPPHPKYKAAKATLVLR